MLVGYEGQGKGLNGKEGSKEMFLGRSISCSLWKYIVNLECEGNNECNVKIDRDGWLVVVAVLHSRNYRRRRAECATQGSNSKGTFRGIFHSSG